MSEVPFHTTRMGHRFFEHTMPELVRQLAQLNENLKRALVKQEKELPEDAAPGSGSTQSDDGANL